MKKTSVVLTILLAALLLLAGCEGPVGPAGAAGEPGEQGSEGQDGQDGQAGQDGQDGQAGPAGPAGPAGATGGITIVNGELQYPYGFYVTTVENAAELQAALEAVEYFDDGSQVNIPAIITMANDITMLGDVTLSANKSIDVNGNTLDMAGSIVNVNGYSLGIGGSTVRGGSFVSSNDTATAEGPRGRVLISDSVTLDTVVFESISAANDLTILGAVQGSSIEIGPTTLTSHDVRLTDVTLDGGVTLTNVSGDSVTVVNVAQLEAALGGDVSAITLGADIEVAGTLTVPEDVTLTANGAINGSGTISGDGGLILNAGGNLTDVTLAVDTAVNGAVTFSGVTTAATITLDNQNLTFADSANLAGATFVFGGTGVLSGAGVATEKLIASVAASVGSPSTIVVTPLDEWEDGNTFTVNAATLTLDGNSGNDSVASTGGETLSLSGTNTVTVTVDTAPTTATDAITYTVDEDETGLLTLGETITVVRDGVNYQVNAQ